MTRQQDAEPASGPALILKEENRFFQLIQTMPDAEEASDLLKRARQAVLRDKEHVGKSAKLDLLLTRCNDEIARVNRAIDAITWHDAIREVFGQEGLLQVQAVRMREQIAVRPAGRRL